MVSPRFRSLCLLEGLKLRIWGSHYEDGCRFLKGLYGVEGCKTQSLGYAQCFANAFRPCMLGRESLAARTLPACSVSKTPKP